MPWKIITIITLLLAASWSRALALTLAPSEGLRLPNLLVNGSFERPDVETKASKTTDGWITYGRGYAVNGPRNGLQGWRVDAGEVDVFSASRTGTTAADGGQYLDLDGRLRGSLSQEVDLPSAGKYRLTFRFGKSSNASMNVAVSFQAAGSGAMLPVANRQVTAEDQGTYPGMWGTESFEFSTSSPGTVLVLFQSLRPASSINGMKLDDVRLITVSEDAVVGVDSDGDRVIDAREETDGTDPRNSLSFEPLSRDLAAHYPLDRNLKDASGHERHASLESDRGSRAFPIGQEQQALQINTNARFSAPVNYDLPSGLSFALWARRSQEVFTQITLADGPFQGASFGWGWNEKGQGPGFFFNVDGTWQGPLASGALDPKRNAWTHVAGTIAKSGLMTVYVDGKKATSFQIPLEIPWASAVPEKVVLDFISRGKGKALGRIDEVRLYARVLDSGEVAQLHGGSNSDRDGDGLLDRHETNTGKYVSPSDTGTDPAKADTNGDGIPDGWAVQSGLNPLDDFRGIIQYVKSNANLFELVGKSEFDRSVREARDAGQQNVIDNPRLFGLTGIDATPLVAGLRLELPPGTPFALSVTGEGWTRYAVSKPPAWSASNETGRVTGISPATGKMGRVSIVGYKGAKESFPLRVLFATPGSTPPPAPTRIIELCFEPVFKGTDVGKSETSYLGVKNVGNSPLTIDGLDLPEGFATDWKGGVLPPGGECVEIPVTCTPTTGKRYSGQITIRSNAQGGAVKTTVECTGRERKPSLPAIVDFGNVEVGSSATRDLVIANSGNAVLTVSGIQYPEGFRGAWKGEVGAAASKKVPVFFSPTRVGDYGGTITVNSDATGGTSTIVVKARGIAAAINDTDNDGVIDAREQADGTDKADPSSFNPLSRHLMAHYPLDGTFNDTSGYSRHATLKSDRSAVAFAQGVTDRALEVKTVAGFTAPVGYTKVQSMSFSLWARRSAEAFTQITLNDGPFKGLAFGWGWRPGTGASAPGFHFRIDGNWQGPLATQGLELPRNEWVHVAGTVDTQGTMTVYVNGQPTGSFPLPVTIPWDTAVPQSATVDFSTRNTAPITGRLDEVRIYRRVLTSEEVRSLYGLAAPVAGSFAVGP